MGSGLPLFRAAGFIERKFFLKAVWKLMTQTGVRRPAQDGSGRDFIVFQHGYGVPGRRPQMAASKRMPRRLGMPRSDWAGSQAIRSQGLSASVPENVRPFRNRYVADSVCDGGLSGADHPRHRLQEGASSDRSRQDARPLARSAAASPPLYLCLVASGKIPFLCVAR